MRSPLLLLGLLASCTAIDSLTGEAGGQFRAVYGRVAARDGELGVDQAGGSLSYGVDGEDALVADVDLEALRGRYVGAGVGLRRRFRMDESLQPFAGAGLTVSSETADLDPLVGGYGALGVELVHGLGRIGLEYRFLSDYGPLEDEGVVLLRVGVQY